MPALDNRDLPVAGKGEVQRERIALPGHEFNPGTIGYDLFREAQSAFSYPVEIGKLKTDAAFFTQGLTEVQVFRPLRRGFWERIWRNEYKIESLLLSGERYAGDKLAAAKVHTLAQLLNLKRGELLTALGGHDDFVSYVEGRLKTLFKQLLLEPTGVFLWAASVKAGMRLPILIADRRQRKQVISDLLVTVPVTRPPEARKVLTVRFGLDDGRLRNSYQLAALFATNQTKILRREEQAFEVMQRKIEELALRQ